MFWIFILITTLGFVLVKLGALSVMVTALSVLLYLALLIIAGLVIVLLWKRVFSKPDRALSNNGSKGTVTDAD
jgi:membrane protein implicated in regulation of membrane protease activity